MAIDGVGPGDAHVGIGNLLMASAGEAMQPQHDHRHQGTNDFIENPNAETGHKNMI